MSAHYTTLDPFIMRLVVLVVVYVAVEMNDANKFNVTVHEQYVSLLSLCGSAFAE